MALTKERVLDKLEILQDGVIQVRWATRVLDDGDLIGERYERYVLTPGQNVSDQPERIRRVANAIWDAQTVTAFQTRPRLLPNSVSIK
jgi:hypothetical protein